VLFIGVAAIQAGRVETKLINAYARPTEVLYRYSAFALAFKSRPDYAILPPLDISGDYAQFLYNGFLSAASNCGVREPYPKLLSSVEAIAAIDSEKTHVYQYDTGCNCMKEITSTIPELLSTFPPKRESRRLLIRVLPSPYRRRGNAKFDGGLIENVNVVGETVEVVGWARLRDDEPLQNIAFFVPVLPVKQSLVSIERPDIAEHFNNSQYLGAGFRVTLHFSSSANAAYAATRLCAQKLAGGSFAMIDNPLNKECLVLWSAPDVDIQPIKAQ
jgi:hypothetical protein